jgi:hypothetical protein
MADLVDTPRDTLDVGAAAVIAACGGACLVLGILTVLSGASVGFKGLLDLYPPAGSLSGKAAISVLVFFCSRPILKRVWQDRKIDTRRCLAWCGAMIVVGLLGTFPSFLYVFGH